MKSIKKHLALFSVLLLITESTTVVCNAATLSIDDVQQAKSNWCWAAYSEMVGQWEYGDKDQK